MKWLSSLLICLCFVSGAWAKSTVPRRPLDLNKASVRQLMALPGIGRHRARRIVMMRENKPFRRTSELLKIRGIGRKMYYRLRPYIRVLPAQTKPLKD